MEVKKLDKRNTGHEFFKYYIKFSSIRGPDLHELREWCWQTWGSSKEMQDWVHDNARQNAVVPKQVSCQNAHWCWQNDEYYRRIYLASDQELLMYKLKWE